MYVGKGFVQNEIGKLKAAVQNDFVSKDFLETKLQLEHATHDQFTEQFTNFENDIKKLRSDLKKTHTLAESRV